MKNNKSKKDKNVSGLFTWNKDQVIKENIERNRDVNWYKDKYNSNLKKGFILSIFTFIFVITSCFVIKDKTTNTKKYITSTSGAIIQYKMTDKKKQELKEALTLLTNKARERNK